MTTIVMYPVGQSSATTIVLRQPGVTGPNTYNVSVVEQGNLADQLDLPQPSNEIGWWGPPKPYLVPGYRLPTLRRDAYAPGAHLEVTVALLPGTAFGVDGELIILGEVLDLDLAAA